LFHNLRINIFIYYLLTVIGFIAVVYYFVDILKIDNLYLLALIILCIIIISGIFISKLAVDPLSDYVHHLQALSKETLHELNLPISTITTNTQMLSKEIENEKNLKRISRINNACNMLQERYNELDYLIKMQTEQDVKEEFRVDELIAQRVSFLQKLYPHIAFHTELSVMELIGDKTGLSKVIDNLIDNAVKYSGDSKDIDIKLENKTLLIQDYGVGMDEVELLQIFDKYYQTNKDMQGFGIGLSLVKRFCDKNAIELNFESSKNVGTIVKLKFK
jgi:signal transduction histidine kinase